MGCLQCLHIVDMFVNACVMCFMCPFVFRMGHAAPCGALMSFPMVPMFRIPQVFPLPSENGAQPHHTCCCSGSCRLFALLREDGHRINILCGRWVHGYIARTSCALRVWGRGHAELQISHGGVRACEGVHTIMPQLQHGLPCDDPSLLHRVQMYNAQDGCCMDRSRVCHSCVQAPGFPAS